MSGPALARDRTGRRYMIPDPAPDGPVVECPSVTTILNKINKPALVNWAALEVAKFAVSNPDKWMSLDEQAAVDVLKRAPYRNSRKKMDIGSAVHLAIDTWIKAGKPDSITNPTELDNLDLLPYIAGAIRFLNDHVRKIVRSEVTFANLTYRYAGTCDLVATLNDGRVAVIDWKSGKRLYPEVALQLAAYANAEFAVNDDGSRYNVAPATIGVGVHLDGQGGYTAQPVEMSDQLFRTFIALRTLQKWSDTMESSVLGDPLPHGDELEGLEEKLQGAIK